MSYKAGIIDAIAELKERNGSSMAAIKKLMVSKLPSDKKWMNNTFLSALKSGVKSGELVQIKGSYKLSTDFKKTLTKKVTKATSEETPAPKSKKPAAPVVKKVTKAKTEPKKKTTAPKKKATKAKTTKAPAVKKSPKKKTEPKKKTVTKKATTTKKPRKASAAKKTTKK